MSRKQVNLGWMSTDEFTIIKDKVKVAIIPVGSNEQHSTNTTLNTDTVLAERVAERVALQLNGKGIVLPSLSVGVSYHHMAWAGTMTISPQTMQAMLIDYVHSMKVHGIEYFVFLNGHGGNQAALTSISHYLRYEEKVSILNCFYWNAAENEIAQESETERYGHACEIETSFAMYLAPEIVRNNKLHPGKIKQFPVHGTAINKPNQVELPYHFHELTADGSFGDATLSSKEKGEKLITLIINRLTNTVESFIAYHP
ncbi:creatininase family protein [Salibacterium aidingense]|uniref:creatininase family protein n=1 Tax=Salibacterium aidingense TaxID=384933 RepID=UPI003BBBD7F1